MFALVLFLGLYSYLIFFLGVFGLLFPKIIIFFSVLYLLATVYILRNDLQDKFKATKLNFSLLSKFLLSLVFIQAIINFVGTLGPEISFDALWYHLTLPKIFLESHKIFHIPGTLLYYSDMPKILEMLYLPTLILNTEVFAKIIHFSFGILTLFIIYKIAVKFLPRTLGLVSVLIFYSNLVVGWESLTAYVDLGTAFFQAVAFYLFLNWSENKNRKNLIFCAIVLGFGITTKFIAIYCLLIFIPLIFYIGLKNKMNLRENLINSILFIFCSILVPLPWLIFSFLNTQNPFYPLLSSTLHLNYSFNLIDFVKQFLISSDPINPIYIILIPLGFLVIRGRDIKFNILKIYTLISLIIFYLTFSVGGTRFLLPYLAVISVCCAAIIFNLKAANVRKVLISIVIFVSIISIGYRGLANAKYIPYVLGKESKPEFLSKSLNFSFGDFYDTDNYFKKNIKSIDKVLLFGFHNLYYLDFPFIDSSWVKKADNFNYIATQNTMLPKRFSNWKQVHSDKATGVKVYTLNKKLWVY